MILTNILGLFTEFGPWRPIRSTASSSSSSSSSSSKLSLVRNPFTWSTYANLVFIEQPVGVGFSHSKESIPHTGKLSRSYD